MKSILPILSFAMAAGTQLHAADIVTGDVTSTLGPDFFFDSASVGGGTDFNSSNQGFARDFGALDVGNGGSNVTITGIGWASSAGGTVATEVTATITYLGADELVGGGDDVVVGSVTDTLVFSGAGEYVWDFDSPLTAVLSGEGSRFLIQITANGNIRYKTFPNSSGAGNVKLSAAGTSTAVVLADSDLDEIPDIYETDTGIYVSPTNTGTDPLDDDSDGDTFLDGEEVDTIGTDPNLADTDDDGLDDNIEADPGALGYTGTNPLLYDTDDDGLRDGAETNTGTYENEDDTGTDPLEPDTDFDGLKDGVETNTGVYIDETDTGTNPNDDDWDNDLLLDGWETGNGTNPFVADANGDPDVDDLDNISERDAGTDPQDPDSDNDGLSDGIEANNLLAGYTGTNPNSRDSDNDSLGDKFEIDNGLDAFSNADFDNDTFSDRFEVLFYGSDPKVGTSFPGDGTHPAPGTLTPVLDGGPVAAVGDFGLGETLNSAVVNEVAQGGSDFDFGLGVTSFTTVYENALPAAGSEVTLTGFAWVVPGAGTTSGDIRVDFYDPGADGVFDGIDADTHLGSATGSLTVTGVTTVMYWNFDTPISFTSSGTALAVRIQSTAGLRIKAQDNFATGLWNTNEGTGTFGNVRASRFSIGGTVVAPEGPRILTITRSGTSTSLTWDLGSAAAVDLERSTDLGLTDPWTKVLTGTTETSYNEVSTDDAAFFRLAVP